MDRSVPRRAKVLAVALALSGAIALPAMTLAAKPEPTQSVSLSFDGCNARVVADWANQPGRYKRYTIRVFNDVHGTQLLAAEGSARSGHVDTIVGNSAGTTKNFIARLWFLDRDGVVVGGAASAWVEADCF
jgi:hypothetical protein